MRKSLSPKIAMSLVVMLIGFWCSPPVAQGQAAGAPAINGVYNGTYVCAQGETPMKLALTASADGALTGLFSFYLKRNGSSQAFTYSLKGKYQSATQKFHLDPAKWETSKPAGFAMVGMEGVYNPKTGQISGQIPVAGCHSFQATKDKAASANVAAGFAPQKTGTQAAASVSR